MSLSLSQNAEADALLDDDPLALLIGMVLDQQVPMERAFSAPYDLAQRLGHRPDAHELASFDAEALAAVFAQRPALHRFPKAMAGRVQDVCRALVENYDGDVTGLWRDAADGRELLRRLSALPGFGKQKSQIFLALLGKQRGVTPPGWREAAGGYGEEGVYRSVADITDEQSLAKVREHKRAMKAGA
jgi:uncharacterized HhH-GPD family protein